MKQISVAFLLWLAIGLVPADAMAEPAEYSKLLDVCKQLSSEYDCPRAIERKQAASLGGLRFQRSRSTLTVKTKAGPIRFKDNESEGPQGTSFSYLAFLFGAGLHVVYAQLWEGEAFIVVAHRTGAVSRLQGFPLLSPDASKMVATSAAGEPRYYDNSVEIWMVSGGGRPVFRYAPASETWEPTSATWLNSSTLRVEGVCAPRTAQEKTCNKLILRLGSRWTVRDDD